MHVFLSPCLRIQKIEDDQSPTHTHLLEMPISAILINAGLKTDSLKPQVF